MYFGKYCIFETNSYTLVVQIISIFMKSGFLPISVQCLGQFLIKIDRSKNAR